MPKRNAKMAEGPRSPSARLSITIPTDDYRDLKAAADRQRVSVAWVAREAVRTYLRSDRNPRKR